VHDAIMKAANKSGVSFFIFITNLLLKIITIIYPK
jgi:hypothetical protein